MHMIKASEVEIRVRGEKAKIGSRGRHKRQGQLGMIGGSEVRIVGGLVIVPSDVTVSAQFNRYCRGWTLSRGSRSVTPRPADQLYWARTVRHQDILPGKTRPLDCENGTMGKEGFRNSFLWRGLSDDTSSPANGIWWLDRSLSAQCRVGLDCKVDGSISTVSAGNGSG
jgi:hypothetical protein